MIKIHSTTATLIVILLQLKLRFEVWQFPKIAEPEPRTLGSEPGYRGILPRVFMGVENAKTLRPPCAGHRHQLEHQLVKHFTFRLSFAQWQLSSMLDCRSCLHLPPSKPSHFRYGEVISRSVSQLRVMNHHESLVPVADANFFPPLVITNRWTLNYLYIAP
jgi:hypothetical protein